MLAWMLVILKLNPEDKNITVIETRGALSIQS